MLLLRRPMVMGVSISMSSANFDEFCLYGKLCEVQRAPWNK